MVIVIQQIILHETRYIVSVAYSESELYLFAIVLLPALSFYGVFTITWEHNLVDLVKFFVYKLTYQCSVSKMSLLIRRHYLQRAKSSSIRGVTHVYVFWFSCLSSHTNQWNASPNVLAWILIFKDSLQTFNSTTLILRLCNCSDVTIYFADGIWQDKLM